MLTIFKMKPGRRGAGPPNQTPAIHLIIIQGVENNPNCLLIAKLPTMGFVSMSPFAKISNQD